MKKIYTFLIATILVGNLLGNTFVVLNNSDSGSGSLRKAVTLVQSGDTITFVSTMIGDTINLTGQITISQNVFIDGISGSNLITINQTSSNTRVFAISTGMTVTIDWLNITGGNLNGAGGAIINNGDLTLNNCRLFDNYILLTFNPASVSGGGAIFNNTTGTLTTNNCEFYGNRVLHNSSNNGIFLKGGAIYNRGGSITINNSSLYDNSIPYSLAGPNVNLQGGALYNEVGNVIINSSTFSNNIVTSAATGSIGLGGAIYNLDSMSINNSTFSENEATSDSPSQGGSIWNKGIIFVYNTIIANGVGPAIFDGIDIYTDFSLGTTTSLGNNLLESPAGSNMVFFSGDIAAAPMLATLAYEVNSFTKTHALDCLSPAGNAGNITNAPSTDQIGKMRVVGSSIDIGAVEIQSTLVGPTITQAGNQLSVPPNGTYQWYFNNGLISGATSFNYTATQNGNYHLIYTDSVGCGPFTSNTANVTGVGIENYSSSLVYKIYPNPAKDYINISLKTGNTIIAQINLYNLLGKLILSKQVTRNNVRFSIQDLSEGIYFIEIITTEGNKTSSKIIINK